MTVQVKREDYEALKKAYADSDAARHRADRAIRWAGVAIVVAFLGLAVAGYGLYDYFRKQNAEVKADTEQVCLNAVANRETARDQDFAAVDYVDAVVAVVDEFAGFPEELRFDLIDLSNARREEINRQRPPLDPDSCPPVPLPPPTIETTPSTRPRQTTTTAGGG